MITHFKLVEFAIRELGRLSAISLKDTIITQNNVDQLEPVINHTQYIYEATLNQFETLDVTSLRTLQQSQHAGISGCKLFIKQDGNEDLTVKDIENFRNKALFNFKESDFLVIYFSLLAQIALLNSIEYGLIELSDQHVNERGNWYQKKFGKCAINIIKKVSNNEYDNDFISSKIGPNFQVTVANFVLSEIWLDEFLLKDLEHINQGKDIDYKINTSQKKIDSFLRKFFKL